jgi:hypothetical protein
LAAKASRVRWLMAARCIHPGVGLSAKDSILEQLAAHARETLAQLKTDGVVAKDVELQVVMGNG